MSVLKPYTPYQLEILQSEGRQLSLPFIGGVPKVLSLNALAISQLILYRADLIADCLIKVEDKGAFMPVCIYHVVPPNKEQAHAITEYLAGRNDK